MAYIKTKEEALNAFEDEKAKSQGAPPELKSIKTPESLKSEIVSSEQGLNLAKVRDAVKDSIQNEDVRGNLFVYEPDNLYEYLPAAIKQEAQKYETQAGDLLKNSERKAIVAKLSDEEQLGLLSALVKSKERVDHYREWVELVDQLEQNDVYRTLRDTIDKVRKEIADVFVEEGASVILLQTGASAFGDSKDVTQRSRGWNSVVGNPNLAVKVNDVIEPVNDTKGILGGRKVSDFKPIDIKGDHVVSELILPFKGRVMTLAPNLKDIPNFLEVFDELELRDRVKIVHDQMLGAMTFHKGGLHHLDSRKPNVLVFKDEKTGEFTGKINDSECASPTLNGRNFHPEGDEHDNFDILIRHDSMPDEDKDNSPDRFLLTGSLLECYFGKNFRKELYRTHFPKIFKKGEKHQLNSGGHYKANKRVEDYFRKEIFPLSKTPIPQKIQDVLVRLYDLDYKKRPTLAEVVKIIEEVYCFNSVKTDGEGAAERVLEKSEVLGRIEIDGQSVRILRLDPDDISDQDLKEHARNLAAMNAAPRKDIPDAARKQKEREKTFIERPGITEAELKAIYPDMSEEEHFRAYSRRGSAEKGNQGSYTRRMSHGMVFGIEMDGRIVAVQAYDNLGKTKGGRPVLEFSKASTLDAYKGKKLNPHLKQFLASFLEKQGGQTPIWFGASVNPKHLANFVKRGWHITAMNDPNVEVVQLAYLHGKDYIDENMIPQGYKAVYMDPLVDKVDWGV